MLGVDPDNQHAVENFNDIDSKYRARILEQYKYKMDKPQMSAFIASLIKQFSNLMRLAQKMGSIGKGYFLRYEYEGQIFDFKHKHLTASKKAFVTELRELKKRFQWSKKKVRPPPNPASLAGVYVPIQAGPALTHFIQTANFGLVDPYDQNSAPLSDYIPQAKNGYMLKNTAVSLFYLYARVQGLYHAENEQYIGADAVMNESFNNDAYPALFTYEYDENGNAYADKVPNVNGQVTYQILYYRFLNEDEKARSDKTPEKKTFDSNRFKTWYFQNFTSLNFKSVKVLNQEAVESSGDRNAISEFQGYLNNPAFKNALVDEHETIKQTRKLYNQYNEQLKEEAKRQGR